MTMWEKQSIIKAEREPADRRLGQILVTFLNSNRHLHRGGYFFMIKATISVIMISIIISTSESN